MSWSSCALLASDVGPGRLRPRSSPARCRCGPRRWSCWRPGQAVPGWLATWGRGADRPRTNRPCCAAGHRRRGRYGPGAGAAGVLAKLCPGAAGQRAGFGLCDAAGGAGLVVVPWCRSGRCPCCAVRAAGSVWAGLACPAAGRCRFCGVTVVLYSLALWAGRVLWLGLEHPTPPCVQAGHWRRGRCALALAGRVLVKPCTCWPATWGRVDCALRSSPARWHGLELVPGTCQLAARSLCPGAGAAGVLVKLRPAGQRRGAVALIALERTGRAVLLATGGAVVALLAKLVPWCRWPALGLWWCNRNSPAPARCSRLASVPGVAFAALVVLWCPCCCAVLPGRCGLVLACPAAGRCRFCGVTVVLYSLALWAGRVLWLGLAVVTSWPGLSRVGPHSPGTNRPGRGGVDCPSSSRNIPANPAIL